MKTTFYRCMEITQGKDNKFYLYDDYCKEIGQFNNLEEAKKVIDETKGPMIHYREKTTYLVAKHIIKMTGIAGGHNENFYLFNKMLPNSQYNIKDLNKLFNEALFKKLSTTNL